MKVKILKSYRGKLSRARQFVPGDIWTVDDEQGAELVKLKLAEEVKTPAPKPAAPAPVRPTVQPSPVVTVDDPAAHSVAEVAQYVSANPDELERIIEAEEAGQNRVTLLRVLKNMKASR